MKLTSNVKNVKTKPADVKLTLAISDVVDISKSELGKEITQCLRRKKQISDAIADINTSIING